MITQPVSKICSHKEIDYSQKDFNEYHENPYGATFYTAEGSLINHFNISCVAMKNILPTPKPPSDWNFNTLIGTHRSEMRNIMTKIEESFKATEETMRVCVLSRDIQSITELPTWCLKKRYCLLSFEHPFYLIEKTRKSIYAY